jgi:(R,R)-butanediol dehydrogenase/meso-butanediol dehydrogenase/diacetyl reductase
MRAAIITGRGQVELQEFPEPVASSGGVVVDVRYCGICGTDVHAYQSGDPYPAALCGHEWAGAVREVGEGVTDLQPGDRVSVAILPPCGTCRQCVAGHPGSCRRALASLGGGDPAGSPHGGYAPTIAVSAARVARIPDGMSDETAAQVEPATVAYHGVRRSLLRLGDVVAVTGAGPIGLFTLQWARAAGASQVIVVEGSPRRSELASLLGADLVVPPGPEAREAVRDATGGVRADVVFECAGRPEAIEAAAELARTGGSLTIVGLSDRDALIRPSVWLGEELNITCSMAYQRAEFDRCIAMLAAGRVVAEPLHTRTVGLEGLSTAFEALAAGPAAEVKVLVRPER